MAANLRQLFIGRVPSAATVVYTALSDSTTTVKARIQDASAVNTSTADATLSVWVPQSGGAAGYQNIILETWTVPAFSAATGGRVDVPALRGRVVESGGTIVVQSSADGVLTLSIDGMEFTTTA